MNPILRAQALFRSLASRRIDAIDLLTLEHMKVETLYLQYRLLKSSRALEPRTRERRIAILEKLTRTLMNHLEKEERSFYPAIEKLDEFEAVVLESIEEHRQIRLLLEEIQTLSPRLSEELDAKLRVMMSSVMHHVREEENEVFTEVRQEMSQRMLERLAGVLSRTPKMVRRARERRVHAA